MKGVIYMRFFARPGEYEPCGIFTTGHLILTIITIILFIVVFFLAYLLFFKYVLNL